MIEVARGRRLLCIFYGTTRIYQIMSEVGVHLVLTCSLIMKLFRVVKRAERICSSSIQWNVYHCPDFHQPALGFIFLEQEAANKVEVEEKPTLRRKQPASPGMVTDQFRDRMANWLLYKGVNDHTKKYCQGLEEGDLLEPKKSKFQLQFSSVQASSGREVAREGAGGGGHLDLKDC